MCRLTFAEIKDWRQFEALAAGYLQSLPDIPGLYIKLVEVQPSGMGADGGVDLLVHITIDDGIVVKKRPYVIQCKFHDHNIGLRDVGDGSITDLITANNACGYLLICKKMATNSLKEHFRKLTKNCPFKYAYEIWSGDDFLGRLQKAPADVIRQFFPGSL